MLVQRRNIKATPLEVVRLVPKLVNYAIIPLNTELYRFRSGAKLFYLGDDTWCVKGTSEDVEAGIREFLHIVRNGGSRKEDRLLDISL